MWQGTVSGLWLYSELICNELGKEKGQDSVVEGFFAGISGRYPLDSRRYYNRSSDIYLQGLLWTQRHGVGGDGQGIATLLTFSGRLRYMFRDLWYGLYLLFIQVMATFRLAPRLDVFPLSHGLQFCHLHGSGIGIGRVCRGNGEGKVHRR